MEHSCGMALNFCVMPPLEIARQRQGLALCVLARARQNHTLLLHAIEVIPTRPGLNVFQRRAAPASGDSSTGLLIAGIRK
jgi:hypothetical protein